MPSETPDPLPPDRRLRLIGVGAGDPALVTLQAIEAIGDTDVVLVLDKGEAYDDLAELRRRLLADHARDGHRSVTITDPERDLAGGSYTDAVKGWHGQRVTLLAAAIEAELADGGNAALLVWGDPSLYDSSLRLAEAVQVELPWPLEVEVVPGISSLHLLTARHRIALNRVGAAVRITTGRRLVESPPDAATDVVVFLDSHCSFDQLDPTNLDIYWGAYLGTADEMLVAGPLAERGPEIVELRRQARERKGWMFDTYLLRWRG